jgi:transcription initiation factor TFIIIB Brf1 subunit/transcription initiation factor TFIIB
MGLAAAVLYLSCLKTDEKKIQRDIADSARSNRSDCQK